MDLSAIFHHGKDQDGFLEEEAAGYTEIRGCTTIIGHIIGHPIIGHLIIGGLIHTIWHHHITDYLTIHFHIIGKYFFKIKKWNFQDSPLAL